MLSLRYREPPDDSAAGGAMEETLSCRGCTCVTGMFIWPQIDDQRQRSLVTAGAQIQTTNISEAVYVLAAVSAWPGVPTRRFRGLSRSVTGVLAHGAAGSAPSAEYALRWRYLRQGTQTVQITLLWRGGPASGFGGAGPWLCHGGDGGSSACGSCRSCWAAGRAWRSRSSACGPRGAHHAGTAACATRPYSRLGTPG